MLKHRIKMDSHALWYMKSDGIATLKVYTLYCGLHYDQHGIPIRNEVFCWTRTRNRLKPHIFWSWLPLRPGEKWAVNRAITATAALRREHISYNARVYVKRTIKNSCCVFVGNCACCACADF